MNVTTDFIEELVSLAKSYSDDAEDATPQGGGSYATHAVISFTGSGFSPPEVDFY